MQHKKEVKMLLADSFKELVLVKPIEKITIKEITDRAGVIRVTFYNHFQDKYELLEWICREEMVSPVRMLLWNDLEEQALGRFDLCKSRKRLDADAVKIRVLDRDGF